MNADTAWYQQTNAFGDCRLATSTYILLRGTRMAATALLLGTSNLRLVGIQQHIEESKVATYVCSGISWWWVCHFRVNTGRCGYTVM
jgi:hypothetical protein